MNKICQFDIVVFGASGYTGQYVVEELVRCADTNGIKWAISGRDVKKLRRVLEIATAETGVDVTDSPVIEADITSAESLRAMTRRTKVVLNCVGPFTTYGEPVIRSCIETTTHYLDLSGEVPFLEDIHVRYDSAAKEKSIYIIQCCGYTPDLWLPYVVRQFDSHVSSVEVLLANGEDTDITDNLYNAGTWKSMIESVATDNQLKNIRQKLYTKVFRKELPETKFKLKRRLLPFRSEHTTGLFVNLDLYETLTTRTNHFRYEHFHERPVQVHTYADAGSYIKVFGLYMVFAVIYLLSQFRWGRDLLIRHPGWFSFGKIVEEGPSRQDVKGRSIVHTYVVSGWMNKMRRHPDDEPGGLDPPCDVQVYRLRGPELAYLSASACLVQCGITVLKEANKMLVKGGVRTPGSVFGGTGVYDRLRQSGLTMLKV